MAEDKNEDKAHEKADDQNETKNEAKTESQADSKKCPECGEPIDNVRVTCSNCGYEYQKEDYEDTEAGTEFTAGSAVDEEGNEDVDHPTGT